MEQTQNPRYRSNNKQRFNNNNRTTALERTAPYDTGGLSRFYWYQILALDSAFVIVYLAWRLHNYCNVSSQRNNLIKLTHYGETKKRVHDLQIVKVKENLKLSDGGPSQGQALTNRLKLYTRAVIESEAWPTVVQLKRNP